MSLPYFPMYPDDFEADTAHLTLLEDGAYNRLLRLCWRSPNCRIPADRAWINRRLRVTAPEEIEAVEIVISEFFEADGDYIFNPRLKREFEDCNKAHKKRVSAGSKGGKAKALKINKTAPSNATAMLKQCSSNQNQNQNQNHIEEDTNVSLSIAHANDASEAVRLYNETASRCGWPAVQKMTPTRSRSLKARLADAGGLIGWQDAIARAEQSDFLNARTAKPWTGFGFDWLTKAANFTKLMEGNYDNRTHNQTSHANAADREIAFAASFARTPRADCF